MLWLGIAGAAHAQDNTLGPNSYLFANQQLASTCKYRLVFQTDGNLVLYEGSTARWASHTHGRGAYATMQSDGNVVVYNWSGVAFGARKLGAFPGPT